MQTQRDDGLSLRLNQENVKRKSKEVLKATKLLACDYIKTLIRQELHQISEKKSLSTSKILSIFSEFGFVGTMMRFMFV